MSLKPDYDDWQQVLDLVEKAAESEQHEMLLTMLMTPDERESLVTRVNILNELLKGEVSQRQLSQMLGVGVATITRGSNELKGHTDEQKQALFKLLKKSSNK
ncbi:trp operon repressor [Vibrio hannami]|uniref:trp operon repressor n=1 Tax=Vibrio hannami TaxID=2717094 RepID=UPI002410265E|nr:trp operon repressor [Vibrio hannami]MDG3087185.1 trp operon repressor [Vibrio hannami]